MDFDGVYFQQVIEVLQSIHRIKFVQCGHARGNRRCDGSGHIDYLDVARIYAAAPDSEIDGATARKKSA